MASTARPSFGYLLPTREAVMSGDVAAAPLLSLAERAERVGYDSVWIGDSIVARPRHEPLALLAAVAARTSHVSVGTAVLLPILRDPVVMAHQVATVDQIAEGRLILGVGIGGDNPTSRHEHASVGVPFERRVGRFMAHIDICRRLWAGETVTHHSDFFTLDEVAVSPLPHRTGGPPIWAAGSAPAAQRRAGAQFDGWFPIGSAEHFAEGLPHVHAGARSVGRDPDEVASATYVTVALHDDADVAEREMNDFMAAYYPAPPAVMRAVQATYAGSAAGFASWIDEFVASGARHIVLRFAGRHDDHLEQCIDLLGR